MPRVPILGVEVLGGEQVPRRLSHDLAVCHFNARIDHLAHEFDDIPERAQRRYFIHKFILQRALLQQFDSPLRLSGSAELRAVHHVEPADLRI